MNLRTRILLGYGYLVALLVLTAAGAGLAFQQLGANIGRVLEDNYQSVRASMGMLESLERQDSATLTLLLGDEGSRELLVSSQAAFDSSLAQAGQNITLEEERRIIPQIRHRFGAYLAARDSLLAQRPERPLSAYQETTYPRFVRVKDSVLKLLQVNHEAMLQADRQNQRIAGRRAAILGVVVALALLSVGITGRSLGRSLLERMTELQEVTAAIAAGDGFRRAPGSTTTS